MQNTRSAASAAEQAGEITTRDCRWNGRNSGPKTDADTMHYRDGGRYAPGYPTDTTSGHSYLSWGSKAGMTILLCVNAIDKRFVVHL
jgi:hypothetical protein